MLGLQDRTNLSDLLQAHFREDGQGQDRPCSLLRMRKASRGDTQIAIARLHVDGYRIVQSRGDAMGPEPIEQGIPPRMANYVRWYTCERPGAIVGVTRPSRSRNISSYWAAIRWRAVFQASRRRSLMRRMAACRVSSLRL